MQNSQIKPLIILIHKQINSYINIGNNSSRFVFIKFAEGLIWIIKWDRYEEWI